MKTHGKMHFSDKLNIAERLGLSKNNSGFSVIELIVVVAILAIATGITSASLSTAFHARSYKAAKTIDSIIAKSKIYAMSGKRNDFVMRYSEEDECFYCELVDSEGNVYDEDSQKKIGNSELNVFVDGTDIKTTGLRITFNMDTGAVKRFTLGATNSVDWVVDGETGCELITLDSFTSHSITLYKSTGEHYYE